MKNTDFDYKRIAQGYKNRPFLHKQVIEQFQRDIGKQIFPLGLDIGCGAGLSTKALKSICTKVIGTDISPEMIQVAKEVCGSDKNMEYKVGKAETISIGEEKADIVTAAGAVQWIDRDLFLENMNQVMREGAYMLVYDFAVSDEMAGNAAYTDWWHGQYLKEFPRPYRDESIWREGDVVRHGFHMVKQVDLNLEYSFTLESFIQFMLIQSNVNVKIDKEGRRVEEVSQWFQETLAPIFHGNEQCLLFKGYSWYLKKE